ncbi:MAG TPA: aldo/keto reductase [Candidatus Saccharimonadales bacterium]|nr:aldo/keto reductase [Candidatus Saccharimonadales bacterium]
MNIPVKTLKNGFSLPVYGLGTWQMGGRFEPDNSNDEQDIAAIKAAIDHGITHIDTAESYGDGHSEELVGQAIKGYDRKKLLIATKVSAWNQTYDGILRSCEASLKRLGTNYVDLYLLHRYPEPGIPIADTMRAMDRLIGEGLVKNIGVCNMTINRFEETQKHTANKVVCNQLEYSLKMREAEARGLINYCQQNDILITAWGPLQKGALEEASILQEMAKKYGKIPYQVALNWLIVQPNVVTIPKTSNVEHLEENLGALGWELSAEDIDRLSREFPNQQTVSERVPLDYSADLAP